MKKLFTIITFSLLFSISHSQKITGTYEGDLGNGEFLQLNIQQIGNNACGYTWDYEYKQPKDHCKANFHGQYSKQDGTWFLNGYSFIENSGTHSLMQIIVSQKFVNGIVSLKGYCRTSPTLFLGAGDPVEITLKRVAIKPTIVSQAMQECLKIYEKKYIAPTPKKNTKPTPNIKPSISLPKKKAQSDSLRKTILPSKKDTIPTKKIESNLSSITNGRVNKEISHIQISDRKIKLEVYDNGTVDGDSVTIFYNNKIILKHQRLSEKPIVIDLDLDVNTTIHSIVLFAENLGSIPPNTALIIFTTPAGKRYELYSSATLEQNAELIFEYKPK